LFREGISSGGFTLLSKGEKWKEKYQKKKNRSMNIEGAYPKGDTLSH
jgi:hypothetical protein